MADVHELASRLTKAVTERTAIDPLSLAVGATFEGVIELDDRPWQGGEGASVGRPPAQASAG